MSEIQLIDNLTNINYTKIKNIMNEKYKITIFKCEKYVKPK
jgi:hypothetical protein